MMFVELEFITPSGNKTRNTINVARIDELYHEQSHGFFLVLSGNTRQISERSYQYLRKELGVMSYVD